MDINWLEDFVCLARTLNFTRAAADRHVTQSAFSRRIKSLELWLGTPLVDRSSYPTRLSTAGEQFLPVAKSTLLQLTRARDDFGNGLARGEKFYNFAVTHSLSTTHLAPILKKLERCHTSIRTQVISDNLPNCCQYLSDQVCDFLLCYRHPDIPLPLDESQFSRIDLCSEMFQPFVGADVNGNPVWSLDNDTSDEIPYLGYTNGSYFCLVVAHIVKDKSVRLDLRHADIFAEALKSFALQQMGIAWLPRISVSDAVDKGNLVSAGGETWQTQLSLSVFTLPRKLDETGKKIWQFFVDSASAENPLDKQLP